MKEKIEAARQKALKAQAKTLGRVIPIPNRGSKGNKFAWTMFFIMLPFFFYYLYEALAK